MKFICSERFVGAVVATVLAGPPMKRGGTKAGAASDEALAYGDFGANRERAQADLRAG